MNNDGLNSEWTPPRLPRVRFSLLALFLFITVVCLALAWWVRPPRVVAEALFQVLAERPRILDDGQPRFDAREYEIFQRSQVELIKSDFVLQAALREPGIASLPILAPHHDPVQWLSGHVEATFLGPSEILAIRIRGVESESGDLQQLVDAVAEAYVKQVIHAEKQRRLMKQDTKARAAAALREEVAEKTLELQSAIEQHDSDSPEVKLAQLELDIVTDLWREVHRGFKTDEIEGGAPDRIRQVQPAVVLPE